MPVPPIPGAGAYGPASTGTSGGGYPPTLVQHPLGNLGLAEPVPLGA